MRKIVVVVLGAVIFSFFSCGQDQAESTQSVEVPSPPVATEEPEQISLTESYLIKDEGVYGILTGDAIDEHTDKLKKGIWQSGEGEFDVWYMQSTSGKELGFVMTESERQNVIKDIYLTSPLAVTEKGIKVGSTFADLQRFYPQMEIHGSEVESRVTATAGHLAFLLDTYSNEYEIDQSKIAKDTKIKMITVLASQDHPN